MAILVCDDDKFASSIELRGATVKRTNGESWQQLLITVRHGSRVIAFPERQDNQNVLICRQPVDEAQDLIERLASVLDRGAGAIMRFQPSEPCFELVCKRREDAIEVTLWVDEGNIVTEVSRWDSLGIRFLTGNRQLEKFINELKSELSC